MAVIIKDGIKRMYVDGEKIFYYLTVENQNYPMPSMPNGVEEGILRGMYKFKPAGKAGKHRAQIFGSGAIINEVLKAQSMLENYDIAADIWSVTSYKELQREATETERWNLLHPGETRKIPLVTQLLQGEDGVFVAASDYMKALPLSIAKWVPGAFTVLGTDGFGLSEDRANLRDHFEVDSRFIVLATLNALEAKGDIGPEIVQTAMHALDIDPDKNNPLTH